jgi:predicted RNA-binding protein with RPS1 domain
MSLEGKEDEDLTQIEAAYITETTKLAEYIDGSEDPLLQVVRAHQQNVNVSLRRTGDKREKKNTKEKWEKKKMHGQFPRSLDDMLVDREQTYRWLKFGDIKGETESLIVVAQDQALGTNYFKIKNTERRNQKQMFWRRMSI